MHGLQCFSRRGGEILVVLPEVAECGWDNLRWACPDEPHILTASLSWEVSRRFTRLHRKIRGD